MQSRVRRVLGIAVSSVLAVGVLAGCSGSDSPQAETPAETPVTSADPTPEAPTSATLTPTEAVTTAEPAPTAPPTTAAPSTVAPSTDVPSTAAPTKAAPTKTPGSDKALRSARRDVASIAPQLESYYRDREYPVDLAQVQQTLSGSGVTLSPGNSVGGYTYDGDAVEFTLCIENTSGAWASYNTKPMSLQDSGRTGGCP